MQACKYTNKTGANEALQGPCVAPPGTPSHGRNRRSSKGLWPGSVDCLTSRTHSLDFWCVWLKCKWEIRHGGQAGRTEHVGMKCAERQSIFCSVRAAGRICGLKPSRSCWRRCILYSEEGRRDRGRERERERGRERERERGEQSTHVALSTESI